jgi:hypothetical protein
MKTGVGVVRDNELKLEDGEASHRRSRPGVIRCNIDSFVSYILITGIPVCFGEEKNWRQGIQADDVTPKKGKTAGTSVVCGTQARCPAGDCL